MRNAQKRTQSLTKIRLSHDDDLSFDLKKVSGNPFEQYKEKIRNLKPLYHSSNISCTCRKDTIRPSLSQKDALSNAAKKKKGHFVSARTIPDTEPNE